MYTLLLIISAGSQIVSTHFPQPSETACGQTARLLVADSTKEVHIEVLCIRGTVK